MCKHLLDKMSPENNLTVVSAEKKGTTIMFLMKQDCQNTQRMPTKSIIDGNLMQGADNFKDISKVNKLEGLKHKLQKKSSLYNMACDHIKQNIDSEAIENHRESSQQFGLAQTPKYPTTQHHILPKQVEEQSSSQECSFLNQQYSILNYKQQKIFYTPESLNNIKLHPHFGSPNLIGQIGHRESILIDQSHFYYGNNQQQMRKSSFFDIARHDTKYDLSEGQSKDIPHNKLEFTPTKPIHNTKHCISKFPVRNSDSLLCNNQKSLSFPPDVNSKLKKSPTSPFLTHINLASQQRSKSSHAQSQDDYIPNIHESIVDVRDFTLQKQHFIYDSIKTNHPYHFENQIQNQSPTFMADKNVNLNEQTKPLTNNQIIFLRKPSIKLGSKACMSSLSSSSSDKSPSANNLEDNQEYQYSDNQMNENKQPIQIYSYENKIKDGISSINYSQSSLQLKNQSLSSPQLLQSEQQSHDQQNLYILKHINISKFPRTPERQQIPQNKGQQNPEIRNEVMNDQKTPPLILDSSPNQYEHQTEGLLLKTVNEQAISSDYLNIKDATKVSVMNSIILQGDGKEQFTVVTSNKSDKNMSTTDNTDKQIQGEQKKLNQQALPQGNATYQELLIKIQTLIQSKIRKILIVDDNPFNILCLQTLLKKFSFLQTQEAHDGKEAVEKVQEENFDLILMDVNMPIMDGLEATQKIKELVKNKIINPTKIFIVTAFGDSQDKQKSFKIGADAHICKPMTLATLYNELKNNF